MNEGSYHTLDRLARDIVVDSMCASAEEQLSVLEGQYARSQENWTAELRALRRQLEQTQTELRLQHYANCGLLHEVNKLRRVAEAKPKRKAAKKRSKK